MTELNIYTRLTFYGTNLVVVPFQTSSFTNLRLPYIRYRSINFTYTYGYMCVLAHLPHVKL